MISLVDYGTPIVCLAWYWTFGTNNWVLIMVSRWVVVCGIVAVLLGLCQTKLQRLYTVNTLFDGAWPRAAHVPSNFIPSPCRRGRCNHHLSSWRIDR